MERVRIALICGVALLALVAAACQPAANTNANITVGTNTGTNGNVNANANAVANTSRNANGGIIDVNITREDFERQKERFEREAREAGRKIGPGASDLWVWTKARAALVAAQDLRDSTINVDVDNSVVTLTGTVATAEQKTKAGEVAKVEGATRVVNNLSVSSGGANANRTANGNRNANTK